jgi:7-cyano-7-deazaguanine synthase
MKKKAVVLLSGGLDSAVALWWAKKQGFQISTVSFDYGQRHKNEIHHAQRLAHKAGVANQLISLRLPWSGSSLTNLKKNLPHHSLKEIAKKKIPSTYVPARNTLFLSFAMSLADEWQADAIVIGANAIDYSGYPDCRDPYLRAFERVANLGTKSGTQGHRKIKILAPLIRLTKKDIVKLGLQLKVPFQLTWSCYKGGRRPCGRCDSCQLRAKGFAEAQSIDTAL